MKQSVSSKLSVLVSVASIVGVALAPIAVSAATATANTTINANVGSTISISSSGTVTLNITPVSGGAQSSASDAVSVSTNQANGYYLTLANNDTNTSLVSGVNTLTAHTGTFASPSALGTNTWGFAIAGGAFDASYSALSNATGSATKWAGVPASTSPQTLKTTSTTASSDATTVWYSAKVDTTKANGTYTDTVVYTATTNP